MGLPFLAEYCSVEEIPIYFVLYLARSYFGNTFSLESVQVLAANRRPKRGCHHWHLSSRGSSFSSGLLSSWPIKLLASQTPSPSVDRDCHVDLSTFGRFLPVRSLC